MRLVPWVLAVLAAVAAVLSAWWLFRGPVNPGTEDLAAVSPSSPAWPPGHTRRYAVELSSTVSAGDPVFAAKVTGSWHLTRLSDETGTQAQGQSRRASKKLRIRAVLEPERVVVHTAPGSAPALRAALSQEAVLTIAPDGALGSVKLAPPEGDQAIDRLARGLLASLGAAAQVSVPPAQARPLWLARERDLGGVYEASYRDCGPGCLEKQKTRYLSLNAEARLGARAVVDRSRVTYRFQGPPALATLTRAEASEATHTESEGLLPRLSSDTTLTLVLEGVGAAGTEARGLLARSESWPDALRPDLGPRRSDSGGNVPRVKLEARLDELRAFKKAGDTAREGRAYVELARQLRQSDQDVDRVLERILAGKDRGVLIDALGSAGTPRAQQALRTVLEKGNLSPADRHGAAMALSLAKQPDQETVALLTHLTEDPDLHKQALYGLGASALRLRESEPARAEAIARDLGARLDPSSPAGEQITLVRALGNSGSPSVLDRLAELSRDPSPALRAAAFDAMRLTPGTQADALLARGMTADESAEVRKACFAAARHRQPSPSLVYAVRQGALGDPSPEAREEAVRTALRWKAPPLDAALAEVAKNDESEEIQKLAAAAGQR